MASLNKVMLIGNLGKDPEMRYTANGNAVTSFTLACGRFFTGSDGERREETEWFDVTTWNKLAEHCSQYLTKGSKAYVEGRLHTRSWEGQDGQKRYRTEVVAQEVIFLDRPAGARQGAPAGRMADSYDDGGRQAPDVEPDDLPFE